MKWEWCSSIKKKSRIRRWMEKKLNLNFHHVGHRSSRSNKAPSQNWSIRNLQYPEMTIWVRAPVLLSCKDLRPVAQIIDGACMHAWTVTSPVTTIFSSRTIRKWNTLRLCVPSMILLTDCAPIMLYASSFRVMQDPSVSISAEPSACLYCCCFVFVHSHDWLKISWYSCSTNPPLLIMFISYCCHQPS